MDDSPMSEEPIDELLTESELLDDAELRTFLVELRAEATAVQPVPSHTVSRLMRRRPRRTAHRGRYAVAVVVGATVLAGGAAAASPLSPISGSAAAVISGLLGAESDDGQQTSPSTGPSDERPQPRGAGSSQGLKGDPDDPGRSATHPIPAPQSSHALDAPHPSHSHPAAPTPHPTPRSTHAGGSHAGGSHG